MTTDQPIRLVPKPRDLGGFSVRRVLPSPQRRMVGPFIFFDHMGPADFAPGKGMDVRPHPHIGLATVTYLFEGEIDHRDSLGFHQTIRPGDVNWMTAGRGIVHSERTGEEARKTGLHMDGIQSWVALPDDAEETAPGFFHHPANTLPEIDSNGVKMRLIAGTAYGEESPVQVFSPIFYLDARLEAGAAFDLPDEHEERAVYLAHGDAAVNGEALEQFTMVVLPQGRQTVTSKNGA
ncbi:MAG: pirin family protein, partial [Alphaproteobacteria bacterium]|nr:pirin family protein [Alphaproteobacteria bacterium]